MKKEYKKTLISYRLERANEFLLVTCSQTPIWEQYRFKKLCFVLSPNEF